MRNVAGPFAERVLNAAICNPYISRPSRPNAFDLMADGALCSHSPTASVGHEPDGEPGKPGDEQPCHRGTKQRMKNDGNARTLWGLECIRRSLHNVASLPVAG